MKSIVLPNIHLLHRIDFFSHLEGKFFTFYFQRRFIFFLLRHYHSIGVLDVFFELLQGGVFAEDTSNFLQFSYIPLIVDPIFKREFSLHSKLLPI